MISSSIMWRLLTPCTLPGFPPAPISHLCAPLTSRHDGICGKEETNLVRPIAPKLFPSSLLPKISIEPVCERRAGLTCREHSRAKL